MLSQFIKNNKKDILTFGFLGFIILYCLGKKFTVTPSAPVQYKSLADIILEYESFPLPAFSGKYRKFQQAKGAYLLYCIA